MCFSTGDLIKVIGIELLSVCCEDISNNDKFELPINHTGRLKIQTTFSRDCRCQFCRCSLNLASSSGLFKVLPEEMPYSTVEEMVSLRPIGLESCLPFTFTSRSKITLGNFTLGAGRALTVLSIEKHEGKEDQVRCHVKGQQEASADVCIPLSSRGEFYECESEECFTLREIMTSPSLRSRRFRFNNTTKSQRPLVLSPIYQVQAIMNSENNLFF